jgi:hypothetical protein
MDRAAMPHRNFAGQVVKGYNPVGLEVLCGGVKAGSGGEKSEPQEARGMAVSESAELQNV